MADGGAERFLIFSVGGSLFAFIARLVGEIVAYDHVYKLPLSPDYMLGLINRFGAPLALIDTAKILAVPARGSNKAIVLKESVDRVAFVIDDVIDIAEADQGSIVKVDRNGNDDSLSARFVDKRFTYNSRAVLSLDLDLLLRSFAGDIAAEV